MMSPESGARAAARKSSSVDLAAAVVANEADARTVRNGELEIGEQRSVADIVSDAARLEQRGHIRTGPS